MTSKMVLSLFFISTREGQETSYIADLEWSRLSTSTTLVKHSERLAVVV